MEYLLYNGILVTGQKVAEGALHIEGDRIRSVIYGENTKALLSALPDSADRMPLNGEARSERSIKGCPFFPRCSERMDKCRTDDPPTAVHSPGHTARCWR